MAEEKGKSEIGKQTGKEIYKQVWRLQSELSLDDPNYEEKLQEVYSTVAKQYKIPEEAVRLVCVEEAKKNWPPE